MPILKMDIPLGESKLKYEVWGDVIRFPTLPNGIYYPDGFGYMDPEQQIRISKAVIGACKEVLKKKK